MNPNQSNPTGTVTTWVAAIVILLGLGSCAGAVYWWMREEPRQRVVVERDFSQFRGRLATAPTTQTGPATPTGQKSRRAWSWSNLIPATKPTTQPTARPATPTPAPASPTRTTSRSHSATAPASRPAPAR